ncbi:MAG: (Fe-S)-binding protein [Deltaproteobacteria bacterium]|nr:(Fe-S)-binding protein [Deltaproteobacteria bacterium]TLN02849.1 MAG: (Fe-S)-binding protein [bacterium]
MDSLKRLEKELKNCVKCGACRAHCPIFTAVGREPVSARGKIALARAALSGQLSLDAPTREVMSKCLLCGRCVEKCANDVPTDLIVLAAREALASKKGISLFHRLAGFLLRNRALLSGGASLASLFGPLLFRKVPATSGLRLRFPLPFIGSQRSFPKIAAKPFLARHPELIQGAPGRPRIVYFVGCMTNFLYPEIGEAAVTLLKSLGCTVIIPKNQHCCGFPALSGGDLDTFRELAERNLAALENHQADYIMTACASCGGAFHRMYPCILGERFPELAERFRALADKAVDASVLLQKLGLNPARSLVQLELETVTYHDPCHLRSRGIIRQPRELLRAVPGLSLVEMPKADSCCGLGGTFTVHHYGTSMSINAGKTAAIKSTGAQTVVTGCPGCMLQISDGLRQAGSRSRVQHTLEILARNLAK